MILLIAMALLPYQVLGGEQWQAPDFLLQAFIDVALKSEYEEGVMPVRKWQKPVKVYIEHKVAEQEMHTKIVQMHLEHLSSIANFPIFQVDEAQSANVTVVFTDQAHWGEDSVRLMGAHAAKRIVNAVCLAGFNLNKKGEMLKAWVVIPVDQATMHRKLVSCVVEELTQILGLPNDSENVYPSIFNDKTPDALLTGLDGLLLKLLYHPQVKVGMKEAEVRPILKKIIREWQQDGTILNADKTIRQGALYPLLGF